MVKNSMYRLAALVVPIVCLVVGVGVALSQYFRLRSLEQERTQVQSTLTFVQQLIADLNAQPLVNKKAAVARTPDEQAVFLDLLRMYAAQHHVDLTRWQAMSAPVRQAAPAGAPNAAPAPVGPLPMISNVEITGLYDDNRRFLYALLRDERLLNLTNIRWERQSNPARPDLTRVAFTLTRYVSEQESLNPAEGAQTPANPGQEEMP